MVRRSGIVRDLDGDDVAALQGLIETVPEYAEQLTGHSSGPSDALSALMSVPLDFDPADKRGIGLRLGPDLVVFADVLLGHLDVSLDRIARLGGSAVIAGVTDRDALLAALDSERFDAVINELTALKKLPLRHAGPASSPCAIGGRIPFLHHADAASATVMAVERGVAGRACNVVDETSATFTDLVTGIAQEYRVPRPLGAAVGHRAQCLLRPSALRGYLDAGVERAGDG
ncbi:MAG: hypothetical protein H7201_02030 [Candidatus Saccharibacteria bacterium]|nr:hypothetical protein [Microbacteriaceae bacterium]